MATCPIMSNAEKNFHAPCVVTCAWFMNGHCAISVLAQTQYHQYMDQKKQTPQQNHKP